MENYFKDLKIRVDKEYKIANLARVKGLDPI